MLNRNTSRRRFARTCFVIALALGACLDAEDPGNLVPKTVVEDPALPQISIAGTKLHAEAFGDPAAPLIIVLHGGPGSDYRAMLPLRALADDGYRVVFWDQRGTGLSQRHDSSTYALPGYLEDLRLVIEHYTTTPDQPIMFIGQSWGAMFATWFINEYGDYNGRVRGAILSEPGAFTKAQLDVYLDELMAAIPLTAEQFNDALWSRQFMSAADHARADYLGGLLAFGGRPSEVQDPNNKAPFWRSGTVVANSVFALVETHGFDFTTNLAAFPRKVLFLRGALNTVVTLDHQTKLAASYLNAEIVTIPNVGHEMIWETADEYLAHTRAYFQQIGFTGGLQ
ncbi:MAG TPA: alpha/beta hydrolase [Kofleriaceae bacterium]